jgi:hypothetical protein
LAAPLLLRKPHVAPYYPHSVLAGSVQTYKKISVTPLYLPYITTAPERGMLQYPSTFHTNVTIGDMLNCIFRCFLSNIPDFDI